MESLIPKYSKKTVWLMGLNAALGSFIFGYNIGVMTSFESSLSYYFSWGDNEDFFFHSFFPIMTLGAMFGALGAGNLSNKFGRRRALMIQDLITIIGCGLVVIPWIPCFPISRFVCGLAVGGFASIVPNYIKGICPTELYGRVGSLVQLLITFGIVVAYAFALALPTGKVADSDIKYMWIAIYMFQALVALIQMFIFTCYYKYEPPEWLLMNNHREGAIVALREVYLEEEARAILYKMEKTNHQSEFSSEGKQTLGYSQLLCCRLGSKKMMRLGVSVNLIQQFVGINAILAYLTDIFDEMNDNIFISRVLTLVGGIINMSNSILIFPLIGKVGRKTIFLTSNIGVIFTLIGISILCGPLQNLGNLPPIFFIMLYLVFFGGGIGPICWLYCGEILTTRAMSICTGVNWFGSFINILLYPFLKDALGLPITFMLYGFIAIISLVYIYFDMVETRGLTAEEIEKKF